MHIVCVGVWIIAGSCAIAADQSRAAVALPDTIEEDLMMPDALSRAWGWPARDFAAVAAGGCGDVDGGRQGMIDGPRRTSGDHQTRCRRRSGDRALLDAQILVARASWRDDCRRWD